MCATLSGSSQAQTTQIAGSAGSVAADQGNVPDGASAGKAPGAKTLYDAYPDIAKTITFNGETQYLIGYDTKSGETIYGGKSAVAHMVSGLSQDEAHVKTLLSYAALPKAIEAQVGVTGRRDEPPDGCRYPYLHGNTQSRSYGMPGTVLEYRYALSVFWDVDCRNMNVSHQDSSATYEVKCGDGSATSTETTLDGYSVRSLGEYRLRMSCLQETKTRWLKATTNGYALTWVASHPAERL